MINHRLTCPKGVHSFRYFPYANSFVTCPCIYAFCLRITIRHSMRTPKYMHWVPNCNSQAKCIMHEQTTKGFGKMNICMSIFVVRIGWRKYLNECAHFGYESLWSLHQAKQMHIFSYLYVCESSLIVEFCSHWKGVLDRIAQHSRGL